MSVFSLLLVPYAYDIHHILVIGSIDCKFNKIGLSKENEIGGCQNYSLCFGAWR